MTHNTAHLGSSVKAWKPALEATSLRRAWNWASTAMFGTAAWSPSCSIREASVRLISFSLFWANSPCNKTAMHWVQSMQQDNYALSSLANNRNGLWTGTVRVRANFLNKAEKKSSQTTSRTGKHNIYYDPAIWSKPTHIPPPLPPQMNTCPVNHDRVRKP